MGIPGSAVATEEFYVAIITPVIHYCMGGLEIDVDSAVLSTSTGVAIPGLYAAGEVAGGVHGNNRLGGNSLLDCVVFGRVAGKAAAKYILGDDMKPTSLLDLSGGGLSGKVESSKLSGGSYEDGMNKTATPSAAPAAPAGGKKAAPAKKKSGGGGGLTMADCWVVLHDRVLNVTNFLSQHPGGELAILTFAGQDVETGTLKRAKSIRAVPKVKVPPPPKQSEENFCVQLKNDFVWHISKMDGCTCWILILTMVFALCVTLTPKP